jgi:uncharacterized membrane protein YgcG
MSDPVVNRIVQSLKSASLKENLSSIPQQNLVPAITKIIKGAVGQNNVVKVINATPLNVISNSISSIIKNKVTISGPVASAVVKQLPQKDLVPVITAIIKGAVGQNAAVAVARNSPVNSIVKAIKNAVALSPAVQNVLRQRNLLPSNRMNNFIPANVANNGTLIFSGPKSGYIFTTRNGKTGYYKNTYVEKPGGALRPFQPSMGRNYSRMNMRELLDAIKKFPQDAKIIMDAIRKLFDEEIYRLRKLSGSVRLRKAGNLLRIIPRNFRGRGDATSLVINNVRNTRNIRELNNAQRNLGKVPNENIRKAFEEQRKRLRPSVPSAPWWSGGGGGRFNSGGGGGRFNFGGGGGGRFNFGGGAGSSGVINPGNWRRALIGKTSTPSGNPVSNTGNWRKALAGAPIPEEQKRAINYAGGVPRAMNQIARVPNGAPEIARTAEALHLTNGNTRQAMEMHNVSAPAINAVKQLGGPKRAVSVLEGLNTLSMKKPMMRRTRRKTLKPRIAELNRVINAVKKKKLISLVAHNVTKTNNIHENENRLKKYYKKVIKANILRTPFAKIAKGAAKKRVM